MKDINQTDINESNASAMFSPAFIPYYPIIARTYPQLTLTDVLVFGFIRFYLVDSTGASGFYFTNLQLSEMLQIGERSVSRAIKHLTSEGLILCNILKKGAGKGDVRLVKLQRKHRSPKWRGHRSPKWRGIENNNIKSHSIIKNPIINSKSKICEDKKTNKSINQLIGFFAPVNPTYTNFYKHKTQRNALARLIKMIGFDKLKRYLEILPVIQGQRYAPVITKPTELEVNLGKLETYVKKNKNKRVVII